MILDWFKSREAVDIGTALADQFARDTASGTTMPDASQTAKAKDVALQEILRRAEREVRTLRLNFYKSARFANAFKWRLIESGVPRKTADGVTHLLVLHLSQRRLPRQVMIRRPCRPNPLTEPRSNSSFTGAINPLRKGPMPRPLPFTMRRSRATPRIQRRSTIWGHPSPAWAGMRRPSSAFASP